MRYVNGVRASTPALWGEQTIDGGVGFERITDHSEIGDGLVEDGGKVGDLPPSPKAGSSLKSSISTLATYSAKMSPSPST